MVQAITIKPSADGWAVRTEAFDSEMFFRSGAEAEAAARRLGTKIARTGAAVEIQIFLRDGALGGRYLCPPGRSARLQPSGPDRAPPKASRASRR